MANITYICGNARSLDQIKPLWEELNRHHLSVSPYFKEYYRTLKFEIRKQAILLRAIGGDVRVDLASDDTGKLVGYCVSSIDKLQTGEIDSIYVVSHCRGQGIGTTLMEKALEWLKSKGAKKNIVSVAVGNEQAYVFYEQFGFYARRSLLEQKKR